jgi:hypothetical protein
MRAKILRIIYSLHIYIYFLPLLLFRLFKITLSNNYEKKGGGSIDAIILTYNKPITLLLSLISNKSSGLLDYMNSVYVLSQEKNNYEFLICKLFNISYMSLEKNIGIGPGFSKLVEQSSSKNILVLENDWCNFCSIKWTKMHLDESVNLLNEFNVVRLRSLEEPGYPVYSIHLKNESIESLSNKHKKFIGEYSYWRKSLIRKSIFLENHGHIIINSSMCNFSFNPFIVNRKFFIRNISPIIIDNSRNVEASADEIWLLKEYKIAITKGLFTHCDFLL